MKVNQSKGKVQNTSGETSPPSPNPQRTEIKHSTSSSLWSSSSKRVITRPRSMSTSSNENSGSEPPSQNSSQNSSPSSTPRPGSVTPRAEAKSPNLEFIKARSDQLLELMASASEEVPTKASVEKGQVHEWENYMMGIKEEEVSQPAAYTP